MVLPVESPGPTGRHFVIIKFVVVGRNLSWLALGRQKCIVEQVSDK